MAGYIGVQPVPKATQRREYFTATSNQTTFNTSGYTPDYVDVYMNGVKLSPADFTATNGSDVVLASGAATGDLLQIISFLPFQAANQAFTGTFSVTGAVDFDSTLTTNGNITINTGNSGVPAINLSHSNANADNFQLTAGIPGVANSGFSIRDVDESTNRLVIDTSGNVGIAMTPDSAVKLSVSGAIGPTNGSNSAPTHTFYSDPDTGMYRSGANALSFTTGGTAALTINSSQNATFAGTITGGSSITATTTVNVGTGGGFYLKQDSSESTIRSESQPIVLQTFASSAWNDRLIIANNGNVGIGNSPESAVKLEINAGSDGAVAISGRSDGGNGNNRRFNLIPFADGGGANYGGGLKIQTRDNVNVFHERMGILSNGDVRFGGGSSHAPTIQGATNSGRTEGSPGYTFTDDLNTGMFQPAGNADTIAFSTAGSERVRIDSSGFFLVGRDDQNPNNAGFHVEQQGDTYITAEGAQGRVLYLTRLTSNGPIVELRAGTSLGGSIGISGGSANELYIAAESGKAILINNNGLLPATSTGGGSDNTTNLGQADVRWKDIYLSGGIYMQGSSTSVQFDDYEEGTWTPVLATSGISVGYSTQTGNFTKIGQEVFVNFQMNINSLSSAGSGTIYISGLPFSFASGKNYGRYNIQTYNVNLDGTFAQVFAYASSGTTLGILYSFDNSTWSGATTSNFAISSTSIISGSFHYIAG